VTLRIGIKIEQNNLGRGKSNLCVPFLTITDIRYQSIVLYLRVELLNKFVCKYDE